MDVDGPIVEHHLHHQQGQGEGEEHGDQHHPLQDDGGLGHWLNGFLLLLGLLNIFNIKNTQCV